MISTILGIESSCDETSAAIVKNGNTALSNIVSSQIDTHKLYGGIVPEVASRKHIEAIIPVIDEALNKAETTLYDVEGIAVTQGPGLIGSLLVGLSMAKSLAFSLDKPLIGINHLEAHISAVHLENEVEFPFVALIVSGGHTNLYIVKSYTEFELIGKTRDDAAGEAFDKGAKLLGLGYPGGIEIDRLSKDGNSKRFEFPQPLRNSDTLDFSYSGIKTALLNKLRKEPVETNQDLNDMCASYQECIVRSLVSKTMEAVKKYNVDSVVISGGVACNSRLRELSGSEFGKLGIKTFIPSPKYCTDNAAMIAAHGYYQMREENFSKLDISCFSTIRPKIVRGKKSF